MNWKSASIIAIAILGGAGIGSLSAQQQATLVRLFLGNAVVSNSNPLPVAATITPSGTQDINIKQVQGAVPSLTNPLWVFPATGATFPVSGTVTASAPVGITPTDRTVTSATGASQTLMAANASRHSLTVENTGNANCGVNPTGGTAAIGGAGTLTLAPLGAYTPRIPTLSAITVICTAGQPIYADEN